MESKNFSSDGLLFASRFLREIARRLRFLRPGSADRALARAIDEGMRGVTISRQKLFDVMDDKISRSRREKL